MRLGDGIAQPSNDLGCVFVLLVLILLVQLCSETTVECKCECPVAAEVSP